jgi:hypothetical protein
MQHQVTTSSRKGKAVASPKEVCSHVLLAPEGLAPFSACRGDLTGEIVMIAFAIKAPPEEYIHVIKI